MDLLERQLTDPTSGWSVGTIGAIAAFVRDPDEPVVLGPLSAVIDRGGVRLDPPAETVTVAYETLPGPTCTGTTRCRCACPSPSRRVPVAPS